ncbi:MAG: hypothetical protein E6J41_15745 [Chloroflexi bacterium]|nr:MAG: hypothetical protein E6J41_15745 [Chloroflexota bacterium]
MTWLWLWRSVIEPSWLSIVSAPFVVAGYVLLGRERREGWLCLIVSQAGLLAIGLTGHQVGLVVVLLPMAVAVRNFYRRGRRAGASA